LYYVMPYVAGESLRARLEREKRLPLLDALEITREVAEALSFAHGQDVVHRDIKPENILLEGRHAMVADFGIAKAITTATSPNDSSGGMAVGTPYYMSPEQAAGWHSVDGRSDIYALGCVLYEMLAGEPPFSGGTRECVARRHLAAPVPDIRVVRPEVPVTVGAAIRRATAKAPADRFQTASEFAAALEPDATPENLSAGRSGGLRGMARRWTLRLLGAGREG
jgi:serine/threonine-protein kinase